MEVDPYPAENNRSVFFLKPKKLFKTFKNHQGKYGYLKGNGTFPGCCLQILFCFKTCFEPVQTFLAYLTERMYFKRNRCQIQCRYVQINAYLLSHWQLNYFETTMALEPFVGICKQHIYLYALVLSRQQSGICLGKTPTKWCSTLHQTKQTTIITNDAYIFVLSCVFSAGYLQDSDASF